MSYFYQCPRCGEKSMEKLETYSHCVNCLYFKDYWIRPDADAFESQKVLRGIIKECKDEKFKSELMELVKLPKSKKIKGG